MTNYYDKEGHRKVPYSEDSTKGSSLLQPVAYKGDVLVQVWVDSRALATLAMWLEKRGAFPRFMSEVVREPLYMVLESLVKSGKVEMVEDTSEARRLLERWFRVNLNRGKRGEKNILHNKVLSEMRKEKEPVSGREGLVEEAVRFYREAEKKMFEEDRERAVEDAKEKGRVVS